MLPGKIIDKALAVGAKIGTERSRCLRMRFNRNTCSRCADQCRSGAITIAEDLHILANHCSECLLCVSACPSGCFEIEELDFLSVLGALRKIRSFVPNPVLGCSRSTSADCHIKTFCFGYLSEEHLIAASVFLEGVLQIDATGCTDCRNGFVIDLLGKKIRSIETKTSLDLVDRLRVIRNKSALDFQALSYDRRGFFKEFKKLTYTKAAGLFRTDDQNKAKMAYSAKTLPFKRELLNRVLAIASEQTRKALLGCYYFTLTATDACDLCFACIGMCPTGALTIANGDDRDLFFSAALCSGCRLCEIFCMRSAVAIENGFSGENPFGFTPAIRKGDGREEVDRSASL
jgi:ferredoxin